MDVLTILLIFMLVMLSIAVVLTVFYLIVITARKRFHTTNNLLTANFCLAIGLAGLFWIIHNIISSIYPFIDQISSAYCMFLRMGPDLFNSLGLYALTMVSINRYMVIAHPNKRFFRKHQWFFISSGIQWFVVILLNIPQAVFGTLVSDALDDSCLLIFHYLS